MGNCSNVTQNKNGLQSYPVDRYFIWSQRAKLNRRSTDYELQIGVLRKALKTGWFLLSALFSDSFRRSINSTYSVNSALVGNFYHNFIIVTWSDLTHVLHRPVETAANSGHSSE